MAQMEKTIRLNTSTCGSILHWIESGNVSYKVCKCQTGNDNSTFPDDAASEDMLLVSLMRRKRTQQQGCVKVRNRNVCFPTKNISMCVSTKKADFYLWKLKVSAEVKETNSPRDQHSRLCSITGPQSKAKHGLVDVAFRYAKEKFEI